MANLVIQYTFVITDLISPIKTLQTVVLTLWIWISEIKII
jgi:hypothetical protein